MSTPKVQDFSPEKYLLKMKNLLKLTDKQVKDLLKLKYSGDNSLIFNDYDIDIPDNVADIIVKLGYDSAFEFIQTMPNYTSLIFSTIEKEGYSKIQSESDKITYKASGTEGLGECKKCGCKQLRFETVQTRSSDEAKSEFYQCVKCGNNWKQN